MPKQFEPVGHGCGDFELYDRSTSRKEALVVRGNRLGLGLSTVHTTVDAKKLTLVIVQAEDEIDSCTDIFNAGPAEAHTSWIADDGRVTLTATPTGDSYYPYYRLRVGLKGVMMKNVEAGVRERLPDIEISDVQVGTGLRQPPIPENR